MAERLSESGQIRYVVDGGANIGAFSVARLLSFGVEGLVAIEPRLENFCLLSENLSRFPKAKAIHAALGGREGEGWLELCGSLNNVLQDSGSIANGAGERVEVRRVMSLVPGQWPMGATWLKLDIEGAEYDCLDDLLMAEMHPLVMSVEFHPPWEGRLQQILMRMKSVGYAIESDLDQVGPSDCVHLTAARARS